MTQYAVRPADLDRDKEAIVGVWARNLRSLDAAAHAAKYDWYYRRNPLGPGRCWVLEAGPDKAVVGTAGIGPRRLRVRGATLRAGIASDYAVDQEHRVLLPALMLQKALVGALGDGLDVVYGLPNDKSLPVVKRVGYNVDATLDRYVKVLGVEPYLARRVPGPRVARRVVAGLADPLLRAVSRETWRPRRGRTLVEVAEFDARFDALWERTADGFGIACERTAEFLRWRYGQYPLRNYTTLGLTAPGGDLLGYAVCLVGADAQVAVVDCWTGADERARDDLLAGLLSWARRRRAASVACELAGAAAHLAAGLARFGFRRRGVRTAIAVNPADKAPPADWYFTLADEDYN